MDYPIKVDEENLMIDLQKIYNDFYTALENTDVFFLMNEEKNGIEDWNNAW